MGITAMAEAWLAQQQSTDLASLSFDERFGLIVDAEYLARENRRLTRRLSEAKLRQSHACLEDFDDPAKRGLDKSLLRQLATGRWITQHLNIVITGVGKTYLACAFGSRRVAVALASSTAAHLVSSTNSPSHVPMAHSRACWDGWRVWIY